MGPESLREQSRRNERLDEDWLHLFPLESMIDELRAEAGYQANGHSGVTLLKTDHLRVVLEAARGGNRIAEHTVEGPAFVHVLEGSLEILAGDEMRVAHAREMAVIPHDRPREMRVQREDAAFLWVLSLEAPES